MLKRIMPVQAERDWKIPRFRNQRQNMRIAKFVVEALRRGGASIFTCQPRLAGQSLSGRESALKISRRVVQPRSQTTVVVLQKPMICIKAQQTKKKRGQKLTKQ